MPRRRHVRKLDEACHEIGIPVEIIETFERLQWLSPTAPDMMDDEDLARARLILELRDELGVNDEAIPIILHLIDQINAMQARMRSLKLIR